MRRISSQGYAKSLLEVLWSVPPESRRQVIQNFLRLLVKNRAWGQREEVIEEMDRLLFEREGSVKVVVKSAFELPPSLITRLEHVLGVWLKQKVFIELSLERGLIGGMIVQCDDLLLDGSIVGSLASLRDRLIR